MNNPIPFISVIIPVYNDPLRLHSVLDALNKQTYPLSSFEIIVVDNGSHESVLPILAPFPNAIFAQENKVGSFAARNKGIMMAKGEILAFTDSDCLPEPDWIQQGVHALQSHPDTGLIGGAIHMFFKKENKPDFIELYDSVTALPQDAFITRQRFAATANMFTYRKVMNTVGLFNGDERSSADAEWGNRVYDSGYRLILSEEAIVRHPARAGFKDVLVRSLRITDGTLGGDKPYKALWPDPFQAMKHHLVERPGILLERVARYPFRVCLFTRIGIVAFYFFIKGIQFLERIRMRCGGEAFR